MKDIVTPVPQEEVRNTIKDCLEKAALVNYERVSAYARIEGKKMSQVKTQIYYQSSYVTPPTNGEDITGQSIH